MKRSGILHGELSKLIAELRHGHTIMITDAGFPVPPGIPCIDLALTKNVPTVEFVLKMIDSELITEKIIFAKELHTNNPSLYNKVIDIFDDCDHEEVAHSELLEKFASTIKCYIHTGEFTPWGNIILVAGTDPFRYFADETVLVPEFYHKRLKQIRGSKKLALFDDSEFKRKDC